MKMEYKILKAIYETDKIGYVSSSKIASIIGMDDILEVRDHMNVMSDGGLLDLSRDDIGDLTAILTSKGRIEAKRIINAPKGLIS